jgi:hypothetical protein
MDIYKAMILAIEENATGLLRVASLHPGNTRKNDRLLREAMHLLPIVAKNGTGEDLDPALAGPDPRHHRYHAEPFAGKGGP